MIDLTDYPWFYLAHYEIPSRNVVGHLQLAFEARLNTPNDIAIVCGKVSQGNGGIDPALVILTGLTLVSGPDDRDDTDEWRQTMVIYSQACRVAAAWAETTTSRRTFIGDRLDLTDLANALDALVQVVRDA